MTDSNAFIWAQDEFLGNELIDSWIAQAGAETEAVALDATSQRPQINEALYAPSLFTSRVVVIRGMEKLSGKTLTELAEVVQKQTAAKGVVLLAVSERPPNQVIKAFEAFTNVRRLPRPRRGELTGWVLNRMRKAGLKPSNDAALALVESVGTSIRDLASAIEQLSIRGVPKVDAAEIYEQFRSTAEQPMWALFDALSDHRRDRAFRVLHSLFTHGDDALAILFALVSQVRYLMQTKGLTEVSASISESDIASALGVSPGRAGVLRRQSNKLSWRWLTDVHAALADADVELKGGETGTALPSEITLERLVSRIVDIAERPTASTPR